MHDLLELPHCGGIMHHACGKFRAIDLAIHGRAGESRLHRGCRLARIDVVDGGIGIVNRHTCFGE